MPLRSDPGSEANRFETGSVVGDEPQFVDLAGVWVGEILDPCDTNQGLYLSQSCFEEGGSVAGSLRDRNLTCQVDFTPVIHDPAEVPRAASCRLELGEVGLPETVPPFRRVDERLFPYLGEATDFTGIVGRKAQVVAFQDPIHRRVRHLGGLHLLDADSFQLGEFAMPPTVPVPSESLGVGFDDILARGRPRTLR